MLKNTEGVIYNIFKWLYRSYIMGANSGIGSAFPYGSPEFTPWFSVGFLFPDLLVFCAMLLQPYNATTFLITLTRNILQVGNMKQNSCKGNRNNTNWKITTGTNNRLQKNTSGIGSAYPYGSPEFTPWFSVGFLLPDLLVFCAMLFDRLF
jgi:hypothetical protein